MADVRRGVAKCLDVLLINSSKKDSSCAGSGWGTFWAAVEPRLCIVKIKDAPDI
jgi:hypothetical protein